MFGACGGGWPFRHEHAKATHRGRCRSHSLKGSQGLGVRKHEGERQEICRAGVRNHKGGSREPWNHALSRACKTGCKCTPFFLHKNYIPETNKPCMLSPRPYVNPRTLMPLTLKHSDHAFGGPGCRVYGVCVAPPKSQTHANTACNILGLSKLQGDYNHRFGK